jgi:hypothetical protein
LKRKAGQSFLPRQRRSRQNHRLHSEPCSGHGTLAIYSVERLIGAHKFEYTDIVRIELNTRPWGHMLGVVDPSPYSNTEQVMVSACFGEPESAGIPS